MKAFAFIFDIKSD